MEYVIVGGSAAGLSALKAIRTRDKDGKVTLVTDEPGRPYYRPVVAKVASGERAGDDIAFTEEHLEALGVDVVVGRAERLESSTRELTLVGGKTIGFDRLLIATGARARSLPIPGADGPGVFTLRTLTDALRLKDAAANAKDAVVVGCGFVGVKATEALKRVGLSVTVIEAATDILQPRLDAKGAGIIRAAIEGAGVKVITSDTASEILREGGVVKGVRAASGETYPADLVVIAVGVTPNVGFLDGAGLTVRAGIVTGEGLGTGVQGVYAAGDVAEGTDLVTGAPAVSALWSNACEMGRIAGSNMAGDKLGYSGFLSVMNATEIAGVPVVTVGDVTGTGYERVFGASGRLYRMLAFDDDVLCGAVFMGELRGAGLYANLVRNRFPLRGLKDKAVEDRLTYADFAAAPAAPAA